MKPEWMTPKILAAFKKILKLSKKYYANPSTINKEELNSYSKCCSEIIIDANNKFLNKLSAKLDDQNTSAKFSWSIINNFCNKKISTAPRLLFNGTLISDFKQKSSLFNVHRLVYLVSHLCLLMRRKILIINLSHY